MPAPISTSVPSFKSLTGLPKSGNMSLQKGTI